MKKIHFLILLLITCFLAGCGNEPEKLCRIKIQSEDSTSVVILDQQSQAEITNFFDEDNWTECENFNEKLIPKYIIELEQEKTPTRFQSKKDTDYEKIMEYTTYEDSDIVKVVISKDTVKGSSLSKEDLIFYYMASENFFSSLKKMIE